MKKFLLFNLVLISIFAKAQTMVDTNKVWNVSECLFNTCGTNVYYFGGDTIIGPHTYKKLNINSDSGFISQPHLDGIREDTAARQVFFYRSGEYLVYDFSLIQGDTFNTMIGITPVSMVVDSVDTIILLNGESRKRMFLTGNPWTDIWIEGIGSNYGMPFMGVYFHTFDFSPELICFKENDTLKFQNPNYTDCFYNTVGISEKSFKNNFELFPNPFSEFTVLKFENPLQETYTLNVFNADGRTIRKYENISGDEIKIEREQLNCGIYFFQLMNEKQILTNGKFLIQ